MKRLLLIPKYYYICTFVVLLYCFLGFVYIDDIRHTVTSSYAILNGHLRDFYDYNSTIPTIVKNDYEIPVYLLFAFWNIPVKIAGLARPEIFPIIVLLYNKLLICIIYLLCSYFVYKISSLFFSDEKTSIFTAVSFALCPVALFGPFIFTQYDSFYVLFMLIGVYYLIRNTKRGDLYIGTLLFGFSILFKPFAIIGFIPLILFYYKNILKILTLFGIVALPTIISRVVFPGANGDRLISRFFESTIIVSSFGVFRISIFAVLYLMFCLLCYFRDDDNIKSNRFYFSAYILYISYAIFFSFVLWHPMWLLIMMPFYILTMIPFRNRNRLLINEMLLTIGFAGTVLVSWWTNIAEDLVKNNAFRYLGLHLSEGETVSEYLNALSIPFYSIFVAALFIDVIIKFPKKQQDGTFIDHNLTIASLDWRNRMIMFLFGILAFTLPPLFRYVF